MTNSEQLGIGDESNDSGDGSRRVKAVPVMDPRVGFLRAVLQSYKMLGIYYITCCFTHGFTVSIAGNIFSGSDCFYEDIYICPDGYTAVRKFPSILDPSVHMSYKMEVLRDPATIGLPLFRVTSENGEKVLSTSKLPSKIFQVPNKRDHDLPVGFRPVHVNWNDLDRCNVCHMDEEYENNLFLQCDKCRMMRSRKCYSSVKRCTLITLMRI